MKLFSDVTIVGGGIIGTSIAYYLSKLGLSVTLLEMSTLADGTTGSGGGSISLQDKKPGTILELGIKSAFLYSKLSEELEYDIGFNSCGGMIPLLDHKEYKYMQQYVAPLVDQGLPISFYNGDISRYIEPQLSPNVVFTSYCPLESKVDPIRVTNGFAMAAKRYGASIITKCKVEKINIAQNGDFYLRCNKSIYISKYLVNAAGVWSPNISSMLGYKIPVFPRKGQIVILESQKSIIHKVMHGAKYFSIRFQENKGVRQNSFSNYGIAFAIEQRGPYLRIGSSRELKDFDRTTNSYVSRKIIEEAIKYIPCIKDLKIVAELACLRPFTPDHFPIIGFFSSLPNYFIATGHEGEGVCLAPITGLLVSELVSNGSNHLSMGELSPCRFIKKNSS